MKEVGQIHIGLMAKAQKSTYQFKVRNLSVPCSRGCGFIAKFSLASIKNLKNGRDNWVCSRCKAKDTLEMNQALINLAKRTKQIRS